MASPCNNLNVVPIKVTQLVRYKSIDVNDMILTIESGSNLYSRRSTIGDLKNSLQAMTGSYTGSFTGSFKGKGSGSFSGSFSGSYWGRINSKNTKATGSFFSQNSKLSGSFSGSYWGRINSKNIKATGSLNGVLSGSFSGSIKSKKTHASGSFSGSLFGFISSKTAKITGSFRGTGSFSGSYWGRINSKNFRASGSFTGSIISKNSRITGSFKGIDNITNFKGTGKKVSFNGTASYAVSSSYVSGPARLYHVYTRPTEVLGHPPASITLSVTKPSGATWYDFEIFLSQTAATDDGLRLQGDINFNTGVITGTSVSQQYDDGTSSPNILPSTGMGNVLQVWYGTVDNDSSLCRWEHTGLIPSTISSTNTISFICGVTVTNGSYDGDGRQVAGLKASYYF